MISLEYNNTTQVCRFSTFTSDPSYTLNLPIPYTLIPNYISTRCTYNPCSQGSKPKRIGSTHSTRRVHQNGMELWNGTCPRTSKVTESCRTRVTVEPSISINTSRYSQRGRTTLKRKQYHEEIPITARPMDRKLFAIREASIPRESFPITFTLSANRVKRWNTQRDDAFGWRELDV